MSEQEQASRARLEARLAEQARINEIGEELSRMAGHMNAAMARFIDRVHVPDACCTRQY